MLAICLAFSAVACKSSPGVLSELPDEILSAPSPEPQETPNPIPRPEPEDTPENDENDVGDLLSRSVMDPEKGVLYGYGDDGYAELQYEVRYLFEQIALPMTVLNVEEVMVEIIESGDIESIEELISMVWENAMMVVVAEDFEARSRLGGTVETDEEQVLDYIESMRVLCNLESEENITSVTIEMLDENTTAAFLTMVSTGWSHLSTYIAIVYTQDGELAYYTLERSNNQGDDALYFFCYVNLSTRGTFFDIENTPEAFIEAILS